MVYLHSNPDTVEFRPSFHLQHIPALTDRTLSLFSDLATPSARESALRNKKKEEYENESFREIEAFSRKGISTFLCVSDTCGALYPREVKTILEACHNKNKQNPFHFSTCRAFVCISLGNELQIFKFSKNLACPWIIAFGLNRENQNRRSIEFSVVLKDRNSSVNRDSYDPWRSIYNAHLTAWSVEN